MKLLKMSLTNLWFWSLDMAVAIAGFYYGFGLEVKNWPALIGFMIFGRWVMYVVHGCHQLHTKRKEAS